MNLNKFFKNNIHFILCLLMTAFGGIFLLWFIRTAGCDVVYTDYIRIVSEYLPDVTDPAKFFVPDVLTRIPAAFLQRIINVEQFSFSVTFDRLCSALGLTACAFMIALYMRKERLNAIWFVVIAVVIFSLNKWEIILNGTAWAHTVSFALFFLNYYLLDEYLELSKGRAYADAMIGLHDKNKLDKEVYAEAEGCHETENEKRVAGREKKAKNRLRYMETALIVLPFIILMFAGEYIASYALVMMAAYGFLFFYKKYGKMEEDIRTSENASSDRECQDVACRPESKEVGTAAYGTVSRKSLSSEGKAEWRSIAIFFIITLAVLLLYLISRHFAVFEHAGTTEMGIFEVISEDITLIPRLFIKSFAGTVFGQQAINDFHGAGSPMSDGGVLMVGLLAILSYIIAIAMYLRHRLWSRTLFPMILMLSGGFNHVVVTASRWIFLNDSYGLSSRYGAQFMVGVIGILLTLAICVKENSASKTKGRGDGVSVSVHDESEPKREASDALKETSFMRCGKKSSDGCIVSNKKSNIVSAAELVLSVVIALMFFFGNRYTTHLEIGIAPYREENYERMQQAVLNYREYEPEELADILEWGKSTDTLINAMEILEENKLNVFSYMEPASVSAK